jgi:hypothetical protein
VCFEGCKGLCALCGRDLNKGPCGCTEEEIDERWSRLKDLDLGDPDPGSAEADKPGHGEA